MPTTGAYEFKRATKSVNGVVLSENDISVGEWAWLDRGGDEEPHRRYLLLIRDPDCGMEGTLWFQGKGHNIDAHGNVSPSILHSWKYGDPPVERCGFHTQPTKLLDFVDRR
jgi:hypothetical protein